jgi:orotate phosphoribosyltransferase
MTMTEEKSTLLRLILDTGVLLFGDFTLKSGRRSPYFFNLGAISSGAAVSALGDAYAQAILAAAVEFSSVFGPAYKGIPLAVATAEALARRGRDVGWAFNRKEAKGHGEGGLFVGAPVAGRLVLVDDVLTAGTAVREAVGLIAAADAELTGVFIAMDRQEVVEAAAGRTAVQVLQEELGVPVQSLLNLQDVIHYLDLNSHRDKIPPALLDELKRYQAAHCVS